MKKISRLEWKFLAKMEDFTDSSPVFFNAPPAESESGFQVSKKP